MAYSMHAILNEKTNRMFFKYAYFNNHNHNHNHNHICLSTTVSIVI